jgi:hypothetical protein
MQKSGGFLDNYVYIILGVLQWLDNKPFLNGQNDKLFQLLH